MKATGQVVLPVVLFTLLSKLVQTFEYVDEILNDDHSNEYWAIALVILFIMLYKVVLALETAVEILEGYHSKKKKNYRTVLSCSTAYYAVQGGTRF